MNELLTFAVLGIGPGAIYGLLGIAIVAVHRGSGVVNFAAGAMAMSSAFLYYSLQHSLHLPVALAAIMAVAGGAVLGMLVYLAALRPLEKQSSLIQMIATLGILIILEQIATLIYGSNTFLAKSVLPTASLHLGDIRVGWDRVLMLVIATALTAILAGYYRLTRTGLATTALAENRLSVITQGFSPIRLNTVTWTIGGALMGVAGILIAPVAGLSATSLTLLVVEALAAALIGNMSSLWATLGGAILIGIAESLTTGYISTPGASEAVPLIAIVVVLILRGRRLPARGYVGMRLPAVGTGRIRVVPLILVSAIVLVSVFTWLPQDWTIALMVSTLIAIICLSVVVVGGLTGQISLAQMALAGLGGLAAAQAGTKLHLPFLICLLLGGVAAVPVGAILAGISFRVRGRNFAIVTMAAGVIIEVLVFDQLQFIQLPNPSIGISLNPITYPQRYAAFCICVFIVLAVGVAGLRRSKLGRRMLGVRANEVAAASLGINVSLTKVWSFAIASFIAGIGGVLMIYQNSYADFTVFDVFVSINVVVWSVLGGIGYVLGPIFASPFAPGGLGTAVGNLFGASVQNYLPLLGGVLLILLLIQSADGAARLNVEMMHKIAAWIRPYLPRRLARPSSAPPRPVVADGWPDGGISIPETRTNAPVVLSVADVSKAFGGVRALSSVTLDVRAREVVGLIGSNGAGKTTLIDVVTGMVRADSGSVKIGDRGIDRMQMYKRSRAGLGRSFQSLELFDELSVTDNLVAAHIDRNARSAGGKSGTSLPPSAREAVVSLGLGEMMNSTPQSLSYGQRRLLAVARSLATDPRVLLLDEPAAGLDEVDVAQLSRMLRRITRETSVGVLLVEHNVGLVMEVCDRIFVLDGGRVIASGTPAEIQENQDVVGAYLGPGTRTPSADQVRSADDLPRLGL